MEAATGTGGAAAHHGKPGGMKLPQAPAAMPIPEGIELTAQGAATGVAAGVVVAEDAGHGQIQRRQPGRNAAVAIAEITHHQQGVGRQKAQQLLIGVVPLAV